MDFTLAHPSHLSMIEGLGRAIWGDKPMWILCCFGSNSHVHIPPIEYDWRTWSCHWVGSCHVEVDPKQLSNQERFYNTDFWSLTSTLTCLSGHYSTVDTKTPNTGSDTLTLPFRPGGPLPRPCLPLPTAHCCFVARGCIVACRCIVFFPPPRSQPPPII